VFIHPGLWDSRTWDDQFEVFADRYRVVRYDVRGYGRSSRPTGEPYSHVRDLEALMVAASVKRAALVGCSMGGHIALDFALTHPDRVSALVLAASGLGGYEGTAEEESWWEERSAGVDEAIADGELASAEDLRLAIWAPLGTDDDAGRRIRAIAHDNIHELTMDESAGEDLDPPAIRRLDQITAPTLVIDGAEDVPSMHTIAEILAARIPAADGVVLEGADHVVNMRKPAEFNRLVLDFLRARLV